MLNKEAFDQWCWRLGLSDQAKVVIAHIRTSPPARRVRSSAGMSAGHIPPSKWGLRSSLRAIGMNSLLPI
jgi:hypothetical protein